MPRYSWHPAMASMSSCLRYKETARIHARRFSRAQPLSDGVSRMMMTMSPRADSYVLRQAARLWRRVLRGNSCQNLVLEHASGDARNDLARRGGQTVNALKVRGRRGVRNAPGRFE